MSIEEAQVLPEAAADAIDALAHLVLFATAEGHRDFADAALLCLEGLIAAPEARRIIPAMYLQPPAGVDTPN
ncbi:hypothetical protein [Arenimonas sp.]|uniref:hypothetical protein n=1 Tax=Arenimonas sp. TaxID=1872635 RepID=UPI0039E57CA2